MTESTLWIQATAIQPIPAISGINPGIFTVAVLTFTSLFAGQRRGEEIDAIGVPLEGLLLGGGGGGMGGLVRRVARTRDHGGLSTRKKKGPHHPPRAQKNRSRTIPLTVPDPTEPTDMERERERERDLI